MSHGHSCRNHFVKFGVYAFLLLSAVGLNFSCADAQQTPAANKGSLPDEHFAPGQVISSGKNAVPTGSLKVKTYRLERVKLAKPYETVEVDGTKRRVETAFRLTITLGSMPTNNYFIWVDEVPYEAYPSGFEQLNGENSISFLLYGPTLPFENESSLAISLYSRKFELTTLPEKLMVPPDVRTKPVAGDGSIRIKRIRSGVIPAGTESRRVVWITISLPFIFPALNSVPTLHIWDKVLQGETDGYEASFMIGADEFTKLKDGAQVIMRGPGVFGAVAGRLNKSMLDK